MTLKERLLWRGYLPENVPPAFHTADIADLLAGTTGSEWWSQTRFPVRPATFNASKRGITRRTFSFVHPVTMHDATKFIVAHWETLQGFFATANFSLSVPKATADSDRAVEIATHGQLEASRIERLSEYRFVAKTDISRFYHSVYTHSIPWAFHGKAQAKEDRDHRSSTVFFNRADWLLRCGQDGQTVGIPVGPDTSRVFAELVATAIDVEFRRRSDASKIAVIRHVDDVWIGAHTHADAEKALWRYREAMREFELDINESKTKIYSADFRFTDQWPSDLGVALERALEGNSRKNAERMRAALEQAFAMTVATGDDGVLKYVIRFLDRHSEGWENWSIAEPFLKRCVVHFGHTVDYVSRVLVWRHLAKGDLDTEVWGTILGEIIDRHGRIGNDSEVCWAIYACAVLKRRIANDSAAHVLSNCGALSIVAILNCAAVGLISRSVFPVARERLRLESAVGPLWPVILEWKSCRWRDYRHIVVGNEVVESLATQEARLFDITRLPLVFKNIAEDSFDEVHNAIESRPTMYDDDDSRENSEDDFEP